MSVKVIIGVLVGYNVAVGVIIGVEEGIVVVIIDISVGNDVVAGGRATVEVEDRVIVGRITDVPLSNEFVDGGGHGMGLWLLLRGLGVIISKSSAFCWVSMQPYSRREAALVFESAGRGLPSASSVLP